MRRWWWAMWVTACTPGAVAIKDEDPFGDPFTDVDPVEPVDPSDPPDETDDPTDDPTDVVEPVSASIGSAGGVVENDCVEVELPAGAVPDGTTVTVRPAANLAVPSRFSPASDLWEIVVDAPLALPARVSVCFTGDASGLYLFGAQDDGSYAAAPVLRVVGDRATAELDAISAVFVGRRSVVSERFAGLPPTALDVLLVVDNSATMQESQARFALAAPAFLDHLRAAGVDWRVGAVTTDMIADDESGRLQDAGAGRWIDASTPNADDAIAALVQPGTFGSGQEEGRAAAYTALELLRNDENIGFVRADADLAVVVVSDEDDRSRDNPITRDGFVTWLDGYKGDAARTSLSAVVPNTGGACSPIGEVFPVYEHLVAATGGTKVDLCGSDLDAVIAPLAAALDHNCLRLSEGVADGPLAVEMDGTPLADDGWDWDGAAGCVRLTDPVASGTIIVTYRPVP